MNSTPSAEPPELKPQEQPKFWSLKPWWCQPWSIISTGVLMVGGSWMLLGLGGNLGEQLLVDAANG